MKKYFMFVAVAAAGVLASCSSDSLTAGSDPKIEPTQEERVPIQLGVSSTSVNLPSGTTRGTGTVGGVGTSDTNNKWYGHKINVFMFTKDKDTYATTLNLTLADPDDDNSAYYNDAVMITPGSSANKIPGQDTPTDIGEAMLSDGTIQYYPTNGNFDFFGYHGDDAVTAGSVVKTADPWVVPFTITGSQDLMSTKAKLTSTQTSTLGEGYKDYYSAKAARKSVQPVLSFDHLLTRLSFVIIAGNDNAGGWIIPTYSDAEAITHNASLDGALASGAALSPADAKKYNLILDGHKIAGDDVPGDYATLVGAAASGTVLTDDEAALYNSKLPGGKAIDGTAILTAVEAAKYNATLTGAVAAGDPKNAGSQVAERAVYVDEIKVTSKNSGNMKVAWTGENPAEMITWNDATDDLVLQDRVYAYETIDENNKISETVYNSLPLYYKNTNKSVRITPTEWSALPTSDPSDGSDWQGIFTELTAANCTVISPNTNNNLIALTPTYPKMNYSTLDTDPEHKNKPTSIGEALIVAPKASGDYEMTVKVTQKVPTNWTTPAVLNPKSETYQLKIKAPEGGFKKNTSYQVKLTVYGFERIVVTTEILPWVEGDPIAVGQD